MTSPNETAVSTSTSDRPRPRLTTRAIDCGVVCNWPTRNDIYAYLSDGWRDYVPPGQPRFAAVMPSWRNPSGDWLPEARATAEGQAASDVSAIVRKALSSDVERAILLLDEGGVLPAVGATYVVEQLVVAANRWLVDRIEEQHDDRLRGLAVIPAQVPLNAAKEIRRVADVPQIAGVHLRGNALGKPFGHPVYHPIYEAAAEAGLPVVIESGGDVILDVPTQPAAGGLPMTYGEFATLQACSLMTHITSIVSAGLFKNLPELKIVLIGGGAAWLPWYLWRADTEWKGIRREIPWVEVPPSEYFGKNVLVGVNPLARGDDGAFDLAGLLSAIDGVETMCCYASFYPRWNADSESAVRDAFPPNWHAPILHDNAERFYRW